MTCSLAHQQSHPQVLRIPIHLQTLWARSAYWGVGPTAWSSVPTRKMYLPHAARVTSAIPYQHALLQVHFVQFRDFRCNVTLSHDKLVSVSIILCVHLNLKTIIVFAGCCRELDTNLRKMIAASGNSNASYALGIPRMCCNPVEWSDIAYPVAAHDFHNSTKTRAQRVTTHAFNLRLEALFARLDHIVNNSILPVLVLDNVDYMFVDNATVGTYGQNMAPSNFSLYREFITEILTSMVSRYGHEATSKWWYVKNHPSIVNNSYTYERLRTYVSELAFFFLWYQTWSSTLPTPTSPVHWHTARILPVPLFDPQFSSCLSMWLIIDAYIFGEWNCYLDDGQCYKVHGMTIRIKSKMSL